MRINLRTFSSGYSGNAVHSNLKFGRNSTVSMGRLVEGLLEVVMSSGWEGCCGHGLVEGKEGKVKARGACGWSHMEVSASPQPQNHLQALGYCEGRPG